MITTTQVTSFLESWLNITSKKVQKLLTEIEGKIYSTTDYRDGDLLSLESGFQREIKIGRWQTQDSDGSKKDSHSKETHEKSSRNSAEELGKKARSIGYLSMIPILIGAGPIIGLLIGKWLDDKFDSLPWLTIIFMILGFVAAIRETMRLIKKSKQDIN